MTITIQQALALCRPEIIGAAMARTTETERETVNIEQQEKCSRISMALHKAASRLWFIYDTATYDLESEDASRIEAGMLDIRQAARAALDEIHRARSSE